MDGLHLTDESFSKVHLLTRLKKLTIESIKYISACSIFHYIKKVSSLSEFSFDGSSFVELALDDLTDERRQEMHSDIRALNSLPKLSKITVDVHDEGCDISGVIVEGLCGKRKWLHQYQDYLHTFYKVFY